MSITPFTLTSALVSMGVAQVFVGNPLASGGMTCLGATEGPITAQVPSTLNELTAPEFTGEVAHAATVVAGKVQVTCNLILGDPAVFLKIAPWGAAGGGFSSPQVVSSTSVLIIPLTELGGGLAYDAVADNRWERAAGNGVAAVNGAGAAPVNAVWLWKAIPQFNDLPFAYANGGKVMTTVTFTAMFDASKTEGNKVWTLGDPRALALPISVIL